jgi:hypothetical protein
LGLGLLEDDADVLLLPLALAAAEEDWVADAEDDCRLAVAVLLSALVDRALASALVLLVAVAPAAAEEEVVVFPSSLELLSDLVSASASGPASAPPVLLPVVLALVTLDMET